MGGDDPRRHPALHAVARESAVQRRGAAPQATARRHRVRDDAALGGRRGRATDVDPERNAGWTNRSFKNYADHAETPELAGALATLLERAARETCAIMCAEAVWWRCHRRIVADYAITRRVPVVHIFTATKAVRATRTPFAKVDRRRRTLRYPSE